MNETASFIGFVVILVIYASVAVFAVVGSAALTQKFLPARWEQAFYAIFLMAIAGFYMAFTAYFESPAAWATEGLAVAAFCALALLGLRWLPMLIAGYVLHGLWDLAHEIATHADAFSLEQFRMTAIPLAYGVFCAVYDIGVCVYFWMRRTAWQDARSAQPANPAVAVS